jgi:nucleotide-binding universal stress UspA family protein
VNANTPIVCGIDGSVNSRLAARAARTLSQQLGAPLVLVNVVPLRPPMPLAAVPLAGQPVGTAQMAELDELETEAALACVSDELHGAAVEQITERGYAADRLSAVADARDARLIVVGTRGLGAVRSALVGSVSQELAADASRPVMVVPEPSGGALGPGPVVCGVDGSDHAQTAARVAARLAEDLQCALTVVLVRTSQRTGDGIAAGVSAMTAVTSGVDHVERAVISGDPACELTRAAADRRAALLVVGSRGRGPVRAALLGSVSATTARHAHCPVLIVPPAVAARYA